MVQRISHSIVSRPVAFPASDWPFAKTHAEFVSIHRGEPVIRSGDIPPLIQVLSGAVLLNYDTQGARPIREIVKAAGALVFHAEFHQQFAAPCSGTALKDGTQVMYLDRTAAQQLVTQSADFAGFLLSDLSTAVLGSAGEPSFNGVPPLLQRLSQLLLEIDTHSGDVGLTQKQLAALLDVNRVSVTNALKQLRDCGAIAGRGKSMRITDRNSLAGIADET